MQADEEHLNLVAVFHYVVAAMTALFSCFALIYIGLGLAMILHPESMSGSHGEPPPAFMGWLFTSIGIAFLIGAWTYVFCLFLAGRFLKRRRHYIFCLVMAGLSCMWMPFGTVLGVFTFIVLLRPEVKAMFASSSASPA
jgi:MFS family permease